MLHHKEITPDVLSEMSGTVATGTANFAAVFSVLLVCSLTIEHHRDNHLRLYCFQGYKVYYTVNPTLPMASWESQMVDNNQLTTVSELIPHTIYTVRVQAFTSVGPGPLSAPVLVKTQQGGETLSTDISTLWRSS